ncbi:hypothetical protein B0J14DRAFT_667447 [Halenospora varia]|nr:hypothetical protein B0J14DRAFT_667447 [Halenospora varia]
MQFFTLLSSVALLPAITLAQPSNPEVMVINIYSDCTQSSGGLKVNPNQALFLNDAGTPGVGKCYSQVTYGALFIEDHMAHPECTLTPYSSVDCKAGTETHAPVSLTTGEAACKLNAGPGRPAGGYKAPQSKSFLFKC